MEMILDNVDKQLPGKEAANGGLDGMSVRAGRKRGAAHISRPPTTAEAGLGTQIEDFLDSSQGRGWNEEDATRLVLPVDESEATRTPTLTSTPVQKKVHFVECLKELRLGKSERSGHKRLFSPQRSTPLGSQLCSFERAVCSASPDSQATQLYADEDLSVVASPRLPLSPVGLSSTEERIEDEGFRFSQNLGENGEESIDTHSEYIDGEWREVYQEHVVNGVVVKSRGFKPRTRHFRMGQTIDTRTSGQTIDTRTSGAPGEDLDKVLEDPEKKNGGRPVPSQATSHGQGFAEGAGSGCDEVLSLISDYPFLKMTPGSTPFHGKDFAECLKESRLKRERLKSERTRADSPPWTCSSSEEAGSGCDEALSVTSDYPAEQGTQRSGSTPFTAWWSEESDRLETTGALSSPPTPTQARSSPRAESEGSPQAAHAEVAAASEALAYLRMLKSPPRCKRCKDRCEKDEGSLYKMSKVRADFFDAKDELIYTTHTTCGEAVLHSSGRISQGQNARVRTNYPGRTLMPVPDAEVEGVKAYLASVCLYD
jgi:hypothetical protein